MITLLLYNYRLMNIHLYKLPQNLPEPLQAKTSLTIFVAVITKGGLAGTRSAKLSSGIASTEDHRVQFYSLVSYLAGLVPAQPSFGMTGPMI